MPNSSDTASVGSRASTYTDEVTHEEMKQLRDKYHAGTRFERCKNNNASCKKKISEALSERDPDVSLDRKKILKYLKQINNDPYKDPTLGKHGEVDKMENWLIYLVALNGQYIRSTLCDSTKEHGIGTETIKKRKAACNTKLNEIKDIYNTVKLNFTRRYGPENWPGIINLFTKDLYDNLERNHKGGARRRSRRAARRSTRRAHRVKRKATRKH